MSSGQPTPGHKCAMTSILLVEDDVDLQLLLQHVLLGAGYEVDTATGVHGGLAMLRRRDYDLVLADGRLQDGTGMMLAELAVERGGRALIITGYAFELPRDQLLRFDFLLKPVRPNELLEAVARILDHTAS